MKSAPARTRRESLVGASMLILGSLLFSLALFILAMLSQHLPDAESIGEWAQTNYTLLFFADEALAFAAAIFSVAILLLARQLSHHRPIAALVGLAAYGVAAIGFVNAVLALGRIIYPVNSLTMTEEGMLLSAGQLFGGIHFAAIALGFAMAAFGFAGQGWPLFLLSLIAGALQIIGTYFGGAPAMWLVTLALTAWTAWSIAMARRILREEQP